MAWPPDKINFTPLGGGEDLVSPAIAIDPARALMALNFEPTDKGYRRVRGYERFDGRTSPSSENDKEDQDALRAAIQAVPGSGPVRGLWIYNDKVYAFRDAADGLSGKMYVATASGWSAVSGATLSPGGRYEFTNYNFGGHSSTEKMYGVNGVDKAFQFDGTTFTSITTGMTVDKPTHVETHLNYLWLTFSGGSLQCSPLADPTGTWTPVTGAAEFAVGDDITGIFSVPGGVLAIFCENSTHLLYGSSVDDWQIKAHSYNAGARPNSIQNLSGIKGVNRIGVFDLQATSSFGDFEDGTYSGDIKPFLDNVIQTLICSFVIKGEDQVWYLFSGNTALISGFKNGKPIGFTRGLLGFAPSCSVSGYINGAERVFVGSEDGKVYEMNRGWNFDGDNLIAVLKLPYNNCKSPDIRKRFRQLTIQVSAEATFTMSYQVDFDYSNSDVAVEPIVQSQIAGQAGLWDFSSWDEFAWDGKLVDEGMTSVAGSGKNVSLAIAVDSDWSPPFTVQGVTWRYASRRLSR